MSTSYGKYLLVIFLTTCAAFNCKSQNLIANSSFENYTNPIDCGAGGFDNYYYGPPPHVLNNWYAISSPDYFNSICTNGPSPGQYGVDVPANYFGYSQPKDGNAYVGAGLYYRGSTIKEYFYQHLASPLVSGKTYCLSFFVTRSDKIPYALKKIGAYFSNAIPTVVNNEINVIPQVANTASFITDTVSWTQIQGCFIANGGEQYITIGNFTQNSMTDTLNAGTNNLIIYGETVSYYYFDDFTLIDQTTVGLDNIGKTNEFEIYPNPTTGLLKVSDIQYSSGEYNVKILDLFGKEIINDVLKEELDISSFDKGVYILLLYKNKQLVVTKKVMKD